MRIFLLTFIFITACSSAPTKSNLLASECGQTPINESDVKRFGFEPAPGKIIVMRIFATWCPFCKTDLERMATLFKDGSWSADKIQILLLAYKNHSETAESVAVFQRERLKSFGLPPEAVQVRFIDQPYPKLSQAKTTHGDLLFDGWQGLPFALVFGKDGRLAYRGHFTSSGATEDQHYKFITAAQDESCSVRGGS